MDWLSDRIKKEIYETNVNELRDFLKVHADTESNPTILDHTLDKKRAEVLKVWYNTIENEEEPTSDMLWVQTALEGVRLDNGRLLMADVKSEAMGTGENGNHCIAWADCWYTRDVDIGIQTWSGHNANTTHEDYFDGEKFELETITYSGPIYVGEEINISFCLNRGVGSENGKKFEPAVKYYSYQLGIRNENDIVKYSETDWMNSFEINLRVVPKETGDLIIAVYGDDGCKSVIKIVIKVQDYYSSEDGKGEVEPEDPFPGMDIDGWIDYWTPSALGGNSKITSIAGKILGVIQVAGTVISVLVLVVIGIKYMFASIEEKVKLKETMLPYVIGCILLIGVSNIASIIYNITIGLF